METAHRGNEQNQVGKRRYAWQKLAMGAMALGASMGILSDTRTPDNFELKNSNSTVIGDTELTIMTANVHGWETPDGKENFGRFLDVLDQENPDAVCIQEFSADSWGKETNKLYNAGYNVLFVTTNRSIKGREGNAVISRAPIELKNVLQLPDKVTKIPRKMMVFTIQTALGKVESANYHLSFNHQESIDQAMFIQSSLPERLMPQIACGDFNSLPESNIQNLYQNSPSIRQINSNLSKTFPADRPEFRFDYVMQGCDERISPSLTKLVDIGSDHLAAIETFEYSGCLSR